MTQPTDAIPNAVRAIPIPQPPPAAPRALTPIVHRRAWIEPRVRLWWLLAMAILILISIYAVDRIWSHGQENNLINHGVLIDAKVIQANGLSMSNQSQPADSPVTLEFDWHGQTVRVDGTLEDRTEYITIGKTVPIRVQADDPQVWTARTEPAPLLHELFTGTIFFPLVPLFAWIAILKKRHFLAVWRSGDVAQGIVADRRQTPIAPLSYAVRCSLPDRGDKRLLTVFVPPAGRTLKQGDMLWLILPPRAGKKNRAALAAMWFA